MYIHINKSPTERWQKTGGFAARPNDSPLRSQAFPLSPSPPTAARTHLACGRDLFSIGRCYWKCDEYDISPYESGWAGW